jgi:hypothetical protein
MAGRVAVAMKSYYLMEDDLCDSCLDQELCTFVARKHGDIDLL